MNLNDFDYPLQTELIASQPAQIRGQSRLLVLDKARQCLTDDLYANLDHYLRPNDLVILNDTKVIPARLIVEDPSRHKQYELVLVESHELKSSAWFSHQVVYRGKLHVGQKLLTSKNHQLIVAKILGNGIAEVSTNFDLLKLADEEGLVPLPPYIKRPAQASDRQRYQTVWAKYAGSVAAPTASLNMTQDLLTKLVAKQINLKYLTLHVGLGTFLPIRTANLADHQMHQEYYQIPVETIKAIQQTKLSGGRIIAIGTTVTRALESANQLLFKAPLKDIIAEANIFIYGDYKFQVVDCLLTNFHAPKSTVLMMASSFAGKDFLFRAYQHAQEHKYQFLSYGDSMFIY